LGTVKNKSGKTIYAWAVEADLDAAGLQSNSFEIEWPPKSGQKQSFPEIDVFRWFDPAAARLKAAPAQAEFLERLITALGATVEAPTATEQTALF
jgi:predicted NUDIX family NTP pyrophosphohydrolase